MKLYCLGLNSKLFKKKKVNHGKGVFHLAESCVGVCVCVQLCLTLCWKLYSQNVLHLSCPVSPRELSREQVKGSVTIYSRFLCNIPNRPRTGGWLPHILHQASQALRARSRGTTHRILPSSLPLSHGSHPGMETEGNYSLVRNNSLVSIES